MGHLGRVAYLQGDLARAAALLAESLAAQARVRFGGHAGADSLEWLGALAGARGQPARAARLFGAAAALRRRAGVARYAPEEPAYARDVAAARAQVDAAAFAAAWAEGEALPLEQAVAAALEEPPAWA